jgi:hypothetical protein
MPPQVLFLNDFDMSQYGMWCDLPQGWGDGLSVNDNLVTVPGHAGGLLLSHEATVAPRRVTVTGIIQSTEGNLRTLWDQVKRILASPILEMRFEAWPDRIALARYQSGELRMTPGLAPNLGAEFALQFLLPSPYLLSRGLDAFTAVDGNSVTLSLGTAPSPLRLIMVGLGDPLPTVTYTDAQGVERGWLQFDLSLFEDTDVALAFGDWIEVDGETRLMTWHKANNTMENAAPYMVAESDIFDVDPQDGDAAQGPSLACSACDLTAYLRKAWG